MLNTEQKTILDKFTVLERAVIYCRTSGDDRERDSLSHQERECQEDCQGKGYKVIATFKEDVKGVSGADFYTPKMEEILELARKKAFDVLLVRDVKRFSRDSFKAKFLEFQLQQYDIRLEFVWEKFTNDSDGDFMKGIHYLLAEKGKSDIVKGMVKGRYDKVKDKNVLTGGNDPFGYRRVIKEKINPHGRMVKEFVFEIVENEARIVRLIFELYVEKNMSLRAIAKQLNEDGEPSYTALRGSDRFKHKDTLWYSATVLNILRNETYAGTWTYGKRKVKTYHEKINGELKKVREDKKNDASHFITVPVPPIVAPELFKAAQAKLAQNKKLPGRNSNHEAFLAKRITCRCGCKMQLQSQHDGKYKYYHCNTQNNMLKRDCDQKNINAQLADDIAWGWFYNILSNKDLIRDKLEKHKEERRKAIEPLIERLDHLNDMVFELQSRYDKLLNLYLSSDEFGQGLMSQTKKQLEDEIKKGRMARDELDEEVLNLKTYYHLDEYHGWPDFEEDEEITFEEKVKYAKKYNLQATIMVEGEKTYLHLTCDFGEAYRELLDIKFYVYQFQIIFSDKLLLSIDTLRMFQEVIQ